MSVLDQALLAISDPTRRAILGRLAQGEAAVMELAAPFKMSQPAISQHLKVLEKAGLITRGRDGTRRPCRLAPEGLVPLDAWLSELRANLERNYARLDDLLAEDPTQEKKS
ncbi:winged helix-turn-helix transcriptional regulator [Rubellimicrobium rubrum]|uniref:Winged helix-turn-helix transcriptional regulator n=1 Tax=Rubellimicrobium rubrum TaxID=2585369 RepID=A0A5C4MVE6_9RHOB|nr:metalloregulator ArsR/SmtB family transcription factor [Rubellimicrobium rubrum]TNC47824.1 winged helix-turn-helix transcriptional regulator [Rubellimicrobium rubrum]